MYGNITVKVKIRLEISADIPHQIIDQNLIENYTKHFSHIMYTDVEMSQFKKVIVRSIHEIKEDQNETTISE